VEVLMVETVVVLLMVAVDPVMLIRHILLHKLMQTILPQELLEIGGGEKIWVTIQMVT
jgi:hypothetical protein